MTWHMLNGTILPKEKTNRKSKNLKSKPALSSLTHEPNTSLPKKPQNFSFLVNLRTTIILRLNIFKKTKTKINLYSNTTVASNSLSLARMGSASSLVRPFFNTTGTFSTNSLASFNPKSMKVLTSFMILIFAAASYFSSFKSNALFSAA